MPTGTTTKNLTTGSKLEEGLEWEKLTRNTAKLIWPVEKASYSSHLRQIVDRQWFDLLEEQNKFSGVLVNKKSTKSIAIAALISRLDSRNEPILELNRDVAWDYRLSKSIKFILNKLIFSSGNQVVETATEDTKLNCLLEEVGWKRDSEEILFGRSLLKRQTNKMFIKGTSNLENVLGRLQPQTPPLPTPSLERR